MAFNILCIGDIVGRPGRQILKDDLAKLQQTHRINFTIANIENAASGFGVTPKAYKELAQLNIQCFTSGNHIFDKKESIPKFGEFSKLIRPLNFHPDCPGVGYKIINFNTHKIAIINLIGRVFMNTYNCPFHCIENALPEIRKVTPNIIVDFHAETTSEKQAMGWFLDGKISAIFGTHTHVMTADEQLLNHKTAYITDIGMTGARNSILGMEKDTIIRKFINQMPTRFKPDIQAPRMINAVVIQLDLDTGHALDIKRIQHCP